MATKTFSPQWVDGYSNNRKVRDSPSYPIGGASQSHVFIKIPDSVKTALNSSSTSPRLDMIVNFGTGASDIDVGHHRERNNRAMNASGIPWYAYNETWRNGGGTGSKTYPMSGWFMPNFLSGNTQGVVLYSYRGTHYASANSIQFRVTGTWNTAPTNPTNVKVDKTYADIEQTLRWDASSDAEGDRISYDIGFYNGLRWTTIATGITGTSYTRYTREDRETIVGDSARFRVRAYDGELYSGWVNSPYWQIQHLPPTFNSNQVSYLDTNSTTVGITGNNQHVIQNASVVRASVDSGAVGNDAKAIKRYIFSLAGQERTRTSIGSVTFNPIDAETNQTLRITAEDSSGMRTTVSKTVTVIKYEPPNVQYTAQRVGSIADETILKVSGSFSPLNSKNSLQTTRYRYRQANGVYTTWRTFNRSISGNNFTASDITLTLDNNYEWEIHIQVSDRVSTRDVYVNVNRGKPILFIDEENDRLGVGKYPENGEQDVEGSANFTGTMGVDGLSYFRGGLEITPTMTADTRFRVQSKDPNGHGYLEWYGSDDRRKGWLGIGGVAYTELSLYSEMPDGLNLGTYQQRPVTVNRTEIIQRGRTGDHHWARFYDGTQICHGTVKGLNLVTTAPTGTLYRTPSNSYFNFAMDFFETPAVEITQGSIAIAFPAISASPSQVVHRWYSPHNNQPINEITYMAVGRWK